MDKINGSLLGLNIDSVSVSCEVSSSINIDMEAVPATAPDSSGWRSYVAGARGWTMELSGNLLKNVPDRDVRYVIDAIMNRRSMVLDFLTQDFMFLLTGEAIPINVKIDSVVNEPVSYSCSFQGSGILRSTIPVWSQNGINIISQNGENLIRL